MVHGHRYRAFSYAVKGIPAIKDTLEALAVKIKKIIHLKPKPPARPKFVLDVHLGKLARHLRLLGFDVIYEKTMEDAAIVRLGGTERRSLGGTERRSLGRRTCRIILTRDIALLKNKIVRHGYFVRTTDPPGTDQGNCATF
ncbi:MAG: hypothetical protein HY210_00435 [Candidatus Omnitrophica bacterium]|nr:hypothetical protein [Candidatus Omnitrophota bacterium]